MTTQFRRLLLLVLCAIALTACSLGARKIGPENKPNNASSSSSTAGSPFSPSNDARKDLHDAIDKLNAAYPYRLTETVSSSPNNQTAMPAGTRVVEFAAADRVHMKSTSSSGGDFEAITLGNKHYWYSGGKWTEGSLPLKANASADMAKKIAEMIKDVKYVGPETVNGVACHLYTCIIDGSMGGQKWIGAGKFWIGAADGLLHQSDSDFEIGAFGGKSHIVYEYNVNIKVEKPAM